MCVIKKKANSIVFYGMMTIQIYYVVKKGQFDCMLT